MLLFLYRQYIFQFTYIFTYFFVHYYFMISGHFPSSLSTPDRNFFTASPLTVNSYLDIYFLFYFLFSIHLSQNFIVIVFVYCLFCFICLSKMFQFPYDPSNELKVCIFSLTQILFYFQRALQIPRPHAAGESILQSVLIWMTGTINGRRIFID